MTNQMTNKLCTNPDCGYSNGEPCVEGFPPEEVLAKCPYIKDEPISTNEEPPTSNEEKDTTPPLSIAPSSSTDIVTLPSGQALRLEEIYEITAETPVKIILCAGPVKSGKSTFITSVYETFRSGPFAELMFSGSRTLLGFEERCHPSRLSSNRVNPETERTSRLANDLLLHLCLSAESDPSIRSDLLFLDISGELFEAVRNSSSEVSNIPFLDSCSFFTLFFDGEKIADKASRQLARQKGIDVLRACNEQGVLGENSNVQIVCAKEDLIRKSTDIISAEEFREALFEEIKQAYANKFASLSFHCIASRPIEDPSLGVAFGVDKMLNDWSKQKKKNSVKRNYPTLHKKSARKFDAFVRNILA